MKTYGFIASKFIVMSKDMSACLWKAGKISFILKNLFVRFI